MGQISVWTVEDNDGYRDTIKALIDADERLTCPQAFRTAEELLAHLESHFAADVLLLDIGLPGMNGIDAVKRVTAKAPRMPVIMLTIHEDNDRIFGALCAGALGYLSKADSTRHIVDAIMCVHQGGASMSPQIARRVLNIFKQLHTPQRDYGLTPREREVLKELSAAKGKARIALDLGVKLSTVDTHVRHIYEKLHVTNKAGAVAKAYKERLLQ